MKTDGLVALPSFIFPDRTRKLASAGQRLQSHRTEGLQAIQAPPNKGRRPVASRRAMVYSASDSAGRAEQRLGGGGNEVGRDGCR